MGDRANFGFRETSTSPVIFLYGHWAGYEMLNTLAQALEAARDRWTDDMYATRICVSQIVGEDWKGSLGYGLAVDHLGDNEHSVPIVNWETQTVSLYPDSFWKIEELPAPKFTMGLDAFVKKFSKTPALV